MLWAYVAGKKESWSTWLFMLAHSYNSTPHAATGFTPYFLLMGYEPQGPVDYVDGVDYAVGHPNNIEREAKSWLVKLCQLHDDVQRAVPPSGGVIPSDSGLQFALEMENRREEACDALALAIATQAKAYNKRRREESLKVGDEVLVNPHLLHWVESRGPGRKLVQCWIGPFTIQAKVSTNVYNLNMPDSYKGSTVINIKHLRKYHRSTDDKP